MITLLAFLLFASPGASDVADAALDIENQIAGALAALPDAELREGAEVRGYSSDGKMVTLREGQGSHVCLADDPARDGFHTACYHRSLEPFMKRGRELKAEGLKGKDRRRIRHEEIDSGELEMPKSPTSLSSVSGESFDPATGQVQGASRIYVVYMPYATPESTGFSVNPNPEQPAAPWIMRQGSASAHIMITPDLHAKKDGE